MNIHEFQGKSLLSQFDIPVQPGIVLDLRAVYFPLKHFPRKPMKTLSLQ